MTTEVDESDLGQAHTYIMLRGLTWQWDPNPHLTWDNGVTVQHKNEL